MFIETSSKRSGTKILTLLWILSKVKICSAKSFLASQPWFKANFAQKAKSKFHKYSKSSFQSIWAEKPFKSANSHKTWNFFHSIKISFLAFIFPQFVLSGQYQTKTIFASLSYKIFCKWNKILHHSHIQAAETIISLLFFLFSL